MKGEKAKAIIQIACVFVVCFTLIFLFFFEPYTGKWDKVKRMDGGADTYAEDKLGGTLNFQCYTNGDVVYNAWLTVVNAFEKASGVKVNLMAGTEVNTKKQTDWQNGNPPDVVSNTGTGFSGFMQIESKSLADLSGFYETARVWGSETLVKEKMNSGKGDDEYKKYFEYFGNEVYLAPYMTATYGMYYNGKLFTDSELDFPENYDELKAVSANAYKNLGKSFVSFPGTSAAYLTWGFVVPAVYAQAKADGNESYFNDFTAGKSYAYDINDERSAPLKKVLERYYEYTHLDGGKYMADCLSKNHTTVQSELYTDVNLSLANGQWLYSELYNTLKDDETGFDLKFASSPLVAPSQGKTAVLLPITLAIAEKASNRPQAEAFLRFIYRDDVQRVLTAAYGYRSIYENFDYGKNDEDYSYSAKQIYAELEKCELAAVKYSWGSLGEMLNAQLVALCPKAAAPGNVASAMEKLKAEAEKFTAQVEKMGRTI